MNKSPIGVFKKGEVVTTSGKKFYVILEEKDGWYRKMALRAYTYPAWPKNGDVRVGDTVSQPVVVVDRYYRLYEIGEENE